MGSGKTEQTMNFTKEQLDLNNDNNIIGWPQVLHYPRIQ